MSNEQPPNPGTEPINPLFAEAPRTGLAPMWVHYSGVSPAASRVADVLVSAAMQSTGESATTLNREFLAWCLDMSRQDKGLQPILDELVKIGFLVIYDGGRNPKTGKRQKRRDPVTNQILPDAYAVRLDPPDQLVGPRNTTEALAAFQADRDVAVAEKEAAGRKGPLRIRRQAYSYLTSGTLPQATPPAEGSGSSAADQTTPPAGGSGGISAGQPHTPAEGVRPHPLQGGLGAFPQVSPTPQQKGSVEGGIEDPSSRDLRSDRSSAEQGPAGAGPAHADDDRQRWLDQLTQLIRRLPWEQVGVKEVRVGEERRMAEAMLEAVKKRGLSFEQVKDHALHSMVQARSNPVVYVTGAFEDEDNHPVRLSDDTYELPPRLRAVEDLPEEPAQEAALPEWCGQCGEGNPAARWNPRLRFHGVGTAEERKCSCHPAHEGAA